MASQCTVSYAPGGKRCSLLTILCMFIVRYPNNMELYSAKVKKISCHQPLRWPLLHVGDVWIHTCSDTRQYFTAYSDCLFLFQYFLVNALCQFIYINSILLTDYISIFMDICIRIYRDLFYPIPFHWTFGYFLSFSIMNCSKYPCMFSFLCFLNISFGSTSHFLHDLRHLLVKIYLLIYELSSWLNCEPTAFVGKSVTLFLPITAWQRLCFMCRTLACLYPYDLQIWTGKYLTWDIWKDG